jgi:hypothetical protein
MANLPKILAFSLVIATTGACAEDTVDDDGIINEHVPEQPEGTVRIVSEVFEVAPVTESFTCMRLVYEATEDIYVNQSKAYQTEGGHHSMLYYTESTFPFEEEPHECNETDMGDIRFVGVGTADGGGIELPEGVALKIPAGAKIFTQSHYLNLENEPALAQDVIDLYVMPADEVLHNAGAFTQVDLGLDLPAGQETTRTMECTMPMDDMTIPWMIPHMHEYGSEYLIEVERDGEWTTAWESTWSAALRDDFPFVNFDPYLELTAVDKVRTTCTWQNTESFDMLFPREMCATFMTFYPSPDGALLACDETGRHFNP